LLRDGLALRGKSRIVEPPPRLDPACDLESRIGLAAGALRSMALTDDFARLVLIAGHGAGMVNNAHAGGLQCGACGGYSGDVNARLLAGLLNDGDVR
ncbi:putative inorganic carbon transporter subunit DabA, partial [Acinetobacter baumannii]